jgi:ATPase subunit of ABC transporter with duplicated ATPase domains
MEEEEQDAYSGDGDGYGEGVKTFNELSQELNELRELATAMDASNIRSKAEKICNQMGFIADDFNSSVGSFSGGWKMRIGLAKVLASDP